MIGFIVAKPKTNSYYPQPWEWTNEPFGALRGHSHTYKTFMPVANNIAYKLKEVKQDAYKNAGGILIIDGNYNIVKTPKGNNLLIEDDNATKDIIFITGQGGFRGDYSKLPATIPPEDTVILASGKKHCCPTFHAVVKLAPGGYVWSETGRRGSIGDIELYSNKGIKMMSTEEFQVYKEIMEADYVCS